MNNNLGFNIFVFILGSGRKKKKRFISCFYEFDMSVKTLAVYDF